MWSNLLSAALLCGVLSTTIVVAQDTGLITSTPADPARPPRSTSSVPGQANADVSFSTSSPTFRSVNPKGSGDGLVSESESGIFKSGGSLGQVPTTSLLAPSPPHNASSSSRKDIGAIAGGVVGGVLFLVLVGALIFVLRRRKKARGAFGSMEKSADERAANYESPSPLPPAPTVAAPESPHSHQNPAAPNEAHALMSHYGDTQPQHMPQEVQPVIMPAKPYDVNSSSREIRDDDDGISINGPSPVTTPSPERQQEQQRSVPRLPIYQGGGKGDAGGDTPPPAL